MDTDQQRTRMQRPDDELVEVDTAARFLGRFPTKVYQLGFNRIISSLGVNGRGRFTMGLRRLESVPRQPGFLIILRP